MIVKAFTAPEPNDPRLHAGWEAEEALAHYLNRQFGTAPDVLLFHGLRFTLEALPGDAAQIDHLVLYRHGIAIIESKSVSGELSVDRLGQWTRTWRGRSGRGGEDNIADPTLQAKRQADVLRELLRSSEPPLLDKKIGFIPQGFRNFPIEHYVAISIDGRFAGATRPFEQRVMKADRITGSISEQIDHHRKNSGWRGWLISKPDEMTVYHLSDAELSRISAFLMARDTPLGRVTARSEKTASMQSASAPVTPTPPAAAPIAPAVARIQKREQLNCPKCKNEKSVTIVSTRRGYCGVCDDKAGGCGTFLPLATACDFCKREASIHKDGAAFYRDCAKQSGGCGKQVVFWVAK